MSDGGKDAGEAPTPRARQRQSLYLDGQLVRDLDALYRQVAHDLYPRDLSKSQFLETLIEYGIAHADEIKAILAASTEE